MASNFDTRRAFLSTGFIGVVGLSLYCKSKGPTPAKDSGGSGRSGGDSGSTGTPETGTPDTGLGQPVDSGGGETGTTPDTGSVGVCDETPDNIEGPFWIPGVPIRTEYDLYGEDGISLSMSGQVTDLSCVPIAGAIVEIWHSNPEGAYDNHSSEMRYRGQMAADDTGRFAFHTIKPGWYLNGDAFRPSHIHVKIWVDGKVVKTTQLYFEGDPHIPGDAFVVDGLILPLSADGSGGFTGSFDFAVDA